jgi:hypothetical protein
VSGWNAHDASDGERSQRDEAPHGTHQIPPFSPCFFEVERILTHQTCEWHE